MARKPKQTKPLHINVPFEVYDALMEMSDAVGMPASRFVKQVLVDALPQIRFITESARAVKAAPTAARPVIEQLADRIHAGATDMHQLSIDLLKGGH